MARAPRILLVYHSDTGGTLQMVRAAQAGAYAAEPSVALRVVHAAEAQVSEMLDADGYVFATPENLAAMSGVLKQFFDRTYYPLLERIQARPYLILVCAGSDGTNAVRQIERIATGWRLKAIAPALIVHTHAQTPEQIAAPKLIAAADLDECGQLGATLASGLALGVF